MLKLDHVIRKLGLHAEAKAALRAAAQTHVCRVCVLESSSLTLGACARGLHCCVCVSVCLSVTTLVPAYDMCDWKVIVAYWM